MADIMLDGIVLDFEAKAAAHIEHHRVFMQDIAGNMLQAFGPRIFDDQLHQHPAQSPPLQIRAQQNRVFAGFVDRIRVNANDADHLAGRLIKGHEGHRARVVELRQPRNEFMAEPLHGRKESEP